MEIKVSKRKPKSNFFALVVYTVAVPRSSMNLMKKSEISAKYLKKLREGVYLYQSHSPQPAISPKIAPSQIDFNNSFGHLFMQNIFKLLLPILGKIDFFKLNMSYNANTQACIMPMKLRCTFFLLQT